MFSAAHTLDLSRPPSTPLQCTLPNSIPLSPCTTWCCTHLCQQQGIWMQRQRDGAGLPIAAACPGVAAKALLAMIRIAMYEELTEAYGH